MWRGEPSSPTSGHSRSCILRGSGKNERPKVSNYFSKVESALNFLEKGTIKMKNGGKKS